MDKARIACSQTQPWTHPRPSPLGTAPPAAQMWNCRLRRLFLGAEPAPPGLPQMGACVLRPAGTTAVLGISLSLNFPLQSNNVIPGLLPHWAVVKMGSADPHDPSSQGGLSARGGRGSGDIGLPTGAPPTGPMAGFLSSSVALKPSVPYKFSSFLNKMIC